jgi:hypothetical protein
VQRQAEAAPPPERDLVGHVEELPAPRRPAELPSCCRDHPCPRHAVPCQDLVLAPRLELNAALRALKRDDLVRLCRRLGFAASGTKGELMDRLLRSARLTK